MRPRSEEKAANEEAADEEAAADEQTDPADRALAAAAMDVQRRRAMELRWVSGARIVKAVLEQDKSCYQLSVTFRGAAGTTLDREVFLDADLDTTAFGFAEKRMPYFCVAFAAWLTEGNVLPDCQVPVQGLVATATAASSLAYGPQCPFAAQIAAPTNAPAGPSDDEDEGADADQSTAATAAATAAAAAAPAAAGGTRRLTRRAQRNSESQLDLTQDDHDDGIEGRTSDAAFNVVQAEINRRRTSRSEPERRHRAGAQGTAAEPTLNALPPPPASVLALPGAISAAAAAAPGSADADSAATDSASADSAQPSAASVSAAAAPGDKPAKRARWAPDVISPALSRQSTLPRPRSGAPSQGSQAPAPRLAPRSAASAAAASSAAADSAATDFASADSAQPSAASVSAAAGSKGSAAPQVQRTGLRSAGPPTNVIDVDSDEGDYSGKPAVVKRSKRSRGQDEGDNAGEPAAAKRSKKSNSNEWIKQFALPMHELLGLTGDIDTFPCVEGVFSLQNAQKHCSKATDSTLVVLPQGAVSVQSVRTFAFHISVTSLALLPPTAHRTLHPYLTSRFPPRFRRPSLRSGMPILVSFPLK